MCIRKTIIFSVLLTFHGLSPLTAQEAKQSFLSMYEYWIDDDYKNKQTVMHSDSLVNLEVDCSCLSSGVHNFYFRGINSENEYGNLHQMVFYTYGYDDGDAEYSGYEYWIDSPSNRVSVSSTTKNISLSIPMDNLSLGVHQFYFRGRMSNGMYGNIYQTMFVRSNTAEVEGSPIVGYRYTFGDKYTETSLSPRSTYQMTNYRIELPNLLDVGSLTTGCSFDFNATQAMLTRKQNVTFYMQFKNQIGNWSNPTCHEFEMEDKVSHDYISLNPTQNIQLGKTKKGDFYAFKCVVSEELNYYLKSSAKCNIDIYTSEGTLLTRITPEDLHRAYSIGLAKGTYYGIVYNMQDDATLRILTNEDYVENPTISFENKMLTITCTKPDASIYYTLDGTIPTEASAKYLEPVAIDRNCLVKAFATYPNWVPSDVTSYKIESLKVKTPFINFIDSKFVIETEPADATIYYTTDGTTPSRQSAQYSEPIFIDYNCTIKAFAVCDNLNDSEIASYNFDADAVRLSAPQIVREGNTLVVTSIPDGASVHYTIDGSVPTLQSSVYTTPIELHHNMVMNAIVMKENCLNSKMVTFVIDEFTCEPVNSMKYNGRYLTLSTTMPESEIHYTIDGTTPTSSSERYNNAIDAEGLNTIRIIVTKKNFNNSKEVTYDTKYYYNGETLSLSEAGTIEKAFEWCGVNNAKSLKVNGNIDNTDLSFILDNPSLRNLDLENTNLSGNTIPDGTFAHTQLVSIFLPKNLTTVGDYLFEGCNNIAAIGCTANIELPSSVISDISNPNLLLYVSQEKYAPSQIRNVVVNGVANDIVLSNGSGNNFYCPREFTARKISYTHNYTQKTVSGKCTGWETIALPFTPTSVTHVKNGQMAPFAASDATKKPFWLCELTEDGFVSSNAIKANTPYIIAMPNNEHYADEYILAGDVTFEGSNVKVLASSGTNYGIMGNKTFVPNFMNVDKTECMTLNVGETYNGYAMGSMFIQGLHNASPFEAYITMEGMESMARRQVFCIDGTATGMETLELGDITIKSYEHGVIVSKTIAGDVVTLYDTVGNVVRSEITNDESVHLKNLPKGIFVLTIKRNGETIKSIKFNL